jgi:hypothetical protein
MGSVILGIIVVGLLLVLLLLRSQQQDGKPGRRDARGKRVKSPPASKKAISKKKASQKVSPQQRPSDGSAGSKDYRAVTIQAKLGACKAAIALQDQVFLAREAPSLPLAGCNASTCSCRYNHLYDRRQDDRRSPYGLKHGAVIGGTEGNRRDPSDRRK